MALRSRGQAGGSRIGVEVFQDGSSHTAHRPEDLDVNHPTFATPDLTTLCRLDELGLEAVGQLLEPNRAVLECRVVADDPWCRKCGSEGVPRDTVTRPLAHEPFGHRPTTLLVRARRYRCVHCRRTWRQDRLSPIRSSRPWEHVEVFRRW